MAAKDRQPKGLDIRRYTSIPSVIDTLRRRQLSLLDPQYWDDKNDSYFMRLYKEYRGVKGLYAMCAAMCPETYHHWRIFTGTGNGGACIVLRRNLVEAYLRDVKMPTGEKVRFDEVEYLKLPEAKKLGPKDVKRLPFLKRVGFVDEDEYRIVIESSKDQRGAYQVDCPLEWIERVYLNPWLPESVADSVINTLLELPGCADLDIKHSRLIDSTTWKKAGDRVAGKKTGQQLKLSAQPRKRATGGRSKAR
ncbi:hypothetical protein NDN16_17650 [Aureimonas altamirensis]|uniref:hypothetical protein n=1 Tax=Aureimonas altamirensis TaxID=370622 RepID=UPI002036762D|nr:hypothetical protein [Aureimonas altamirensis]MCM2505495.1 hypothetical protein [Aureimonas altamirensis]